MHALFLRQLWVTPDYTLESFGTPAYDEIIAHFAGTSRAARKSQPNLGLTFICRCVGETLVENRLSGEDLRGLA